MSVNTESGANVEILLDTWYTRDWDLATRLRTFEQPSGVRARNVCPWFYRNFMEYEQITIILLFKLKLYDTMFKYCAKTLVLSCILR